MRTHECILLVTNQSSKLGYNMNEVLRLDGRLLATGGKRFASRHECRDSSVNIPCYMVG